MSVLDLTPFGFTPTESLVYRVLLTEGPGTGYAVAKAAGLAKANAYGALEGLVVKGAARVGSERPKRYRPESPNALLAKITTLQGQALERLNSELSGLSAPASPSVVEIDSPRALLTLLSHDIGRATKSVALVGPVDAFPLLAPALRRARTAGVALDLAAPGAVELSFSEVAQIPAAQEWPGTPVVAVIDGSSAIVAGREGDQIAGHWSTAPTFIAAARLVVAQLKRPP